MNDTASAHDGRRWLVLAIVCVAYFMTVLDVSIVTVALPSISRALHFSASGLQWVITAYTITFGGFLLLGGRFADLLGRRLIFMTGLAVFTSASLVCGLSGSSSVLIAARAVQGVGAALVSPATLSIITTTFEEGADRNRALGIWGAMGGGGAAAGVLFGGILTRYVEQIRESRVDFRPVGRRQMFACARQHVGVFSLRPQHSMVARRHIDGGDHVRGRHAARGHGHGRERRYRRQLAVVEHGGQRADDCVFLRAPVAALGRHDRHRIF